MGFVSWFFSKKSMPYWAILIQDFIFVALAGFLAYYFEYDVFFQKPFTFASFLSCVVVIVAFGIGFRVMKTYSGIMRYSTIMDVARLLTANLIGSAIVLVVFWLQGWITSNSYLSLPNVRATFMLFVLASLFMTGERIFVRFMFDAFRRSGLDKSIIKNVYIYGVREGGVAIAKTINNLEPQLYHLSGFISPSQQLSSKWLMGVQVYRVEPDLVQRMLDKNVKTVIVSPLQVENFRANEQLVSDFVENGIQILMMPEAEKWDGTSPLGRERFHEVDIEDLLPREKIEVDMAAIGRLLTGKRIMITGAAGSIGCEMVKQVAAYGPSELILIDQAETPMHDVRLLMATQFHDIKAETIVASITNKTHMEQLFKTHRPEYVFHAAAYKHVPMMEDNPAMAVQNNVYGTRVIADLAVKYGTRKFVMISTDKAVNPTNVMGCSKRICEIYCQALNKAIAEGKVKGVTQFVTTRFGNVLGSNGSVIPLFREQIRKGGPVTVTHPDIIRYFMLIPEACKLVLEAGTMGKGGEIFVFDMGKPVRIADLAQRMIKLSGMSGVEIRFTGLRDGEKLYEEVLAEAETTKPTQHPKIMIAHVREYEYETALMNEERLLEASYTYDDMNIVRIMKEIVPEYKSRSSKYEVLDSESELKIEN